MLIGHVLVKIPKTLIGLEKVTAATIGGLEVLAERCTGCDEDCVLGAWLLATAASANGGRNIGGLQFWWCFSSIESLFQV